MGLFGQQGFTGTCNIFAEFRRPVHLVTLREIRPDGENLTVSQAHAATRRIIGSV